jgi:hypothetical protein
VGTPATGLDFAVSPSAAALDFTDEEKRPDTPHPPQRHAVAAPPFLIRENRAVLSADGWPNGLPDG